MDNSLVSDDEKLVEIAIQEVEKVILSGSDNETIGEARWKALRVAIASVRLYIEAAERERCAKIAEAFKGNDSLYCSTDAGREGYVTACREIAGAIRIGK